MSNDNKHHPLDKNFDIASDHFLCDEDSSVEIPDDPTLDTIIGFALDAYKEQMDDLVHIEPKNKLKYLEIAEKFLSQAKDAIYKKEYLDIQRKKSTKSNKTNVQETPKTEETVEPPKPVGVTREELMEQMRLVKR